MVLADPPEQAACAKPARTVLLVLAIAKDTPLRSSRSSIWRSACDPV